MLPNLVSASFQIAQNNLLADGASLAQSLTLKSASTRLNQLAQSCPQAGLLHFLPAVPRFLAT